ncbi:MAG: KH domain-containing protein, partial [Chthoniobacterales bacterium]
AETFAPCKIRVDSCVFVVILSLMREFLEFVIRQLIEFPDEMMLTEIPGGKTTSFKLQLRQSDVGRIIGRNGQTIQAIRALLNSSASRHGQRATLEIVE